MDIWYIIPAMVMNDVRLHCVNNLSDPSSWEYWKTWLHTTIINANRISIHFIRKPPSLREKAYVMIESSSPEVSPDGQSTFSPRAFGPGLTTSGLEGLRREKCIGVFLKGRILLIRCRSQAVGWVYNPKRKAIFYCCDVSAEALFRIHRRTADRYHPLFPRYKRLVQG